MNQGRSRWWSLWGLGCLLPSPLFAWTSQQFSCKIETASGLTIATLSWRGGVLLRLRSPNGTQVESKAYSLLNQLESWAEKGIRPGDWSLGRRGSRYVLQVRGEAFLEMEPQWLRHSHAEPFALGRQWLQNLQGAFAEPYLAVSGRSPLEVPLGQERSFPLWGTAQGQGKVEVAPEGLADAFLDAETASLRLRGRQRGDGEVRVQVGPARLACPFKVRPLAGGWLREPALEWTGSLPSDLWQRALRQNILAALHLQPGASWRWIGEMPSSPNGETVSARLRLEGPECFPVSLQAAVPLRSLPGGTRPARALLLSNRPESVRGSMVLAYARLPAGEVLRWMLHHKNIASAPLRLEMRLENHSQEWQRIYLRPSWAGPHRDEIYIGHQAMRGYWALHLSGGGYFLPLPPQQSIVVYAQTFRPGEVLSGLGEVAGEDGPLALSIVATSAADEAFFRPLLKEAQMREAPLFSQPQKVLEGEYVVGGRYLFFSVGREPLRNEEGWRLDGNYGALYELRIRLHNPTTQGAPVALLLSADGGVARGVFWVEGQLLETGLVRTGQEVPFYRLLLSPGEKRSLTVRLIPQAGSHYPLRIVVCPSR